MTKVKIHFYQKEADERLARIKGAVSSLQSIHNELKSLGADTVTIRDIRKIVTSDNNPLVIREIILRDKDLKVGGITVDSSFLKLPDAQIRELSRNAKRVDPGNNLDWSNYAIADGEVVCAGCVEDKVRERHTVYGTEKTKEIVSDIEALCEMINAIGDKLGVHTYHPCEKS